MPDGRPPWKEMYALRRQVRRRYPDPLRLPRTKRPEALIAASLNPGVRLADVGSGDGSLEEKLAREGLTVDYVSVDPGGGADHDSLAEARGPFGAACLLEVVEHLDPDEGADLLAEVYDRLEEGGLLILSTPNILKPGQFLKDVTHKTAYAWDELGALCMAANYELVSLHRVYNAPLLRKFLHLGPLGPLHRALGVDYARSIMAVGRK